MRKFIFLLLYVLITQHYAMAFWKFDQKDEKQGHFHEFARLYNPSYWDVNYFNVQDPKNDLSINMSYFTLGANLPFNKSAMIIGTVKLKSKSYTIFHRINFDDILDKDKRQVIQEGDLFLDIEEKDDQTFFALRNEYTFITFKLKGSFSYHDLSKVNLTSNIHKKEFINWIPKITNSKVEGLLKYNGKSIHFSAKSRGYYDKLWGLWSPSDNPYYWISAKSDKLDITLVQFKSKSSLLDQNTSFGGIRISLKDGTQIKFNQNEIDIEIMWKKLIDTLSINPFESGVYINKSAASRHYATKHFKVYAENLDCKLELDIQNNRFDSKSLHKVSQLVLGEFSIDDALSHVKGILKCYDRDDIKISLQGSFQEIN